MEIKNAKEDKRMDRVEEMSKIELEAKLATLKLEKELLVLEFLGKRLKHYRERAGLSIIEVARRLGISERTIARYERGDQKPAVEYMILGAAMFGVKQEDLGYYFFGKNMSFEEACKIITPKVNELISDGKRTI